MNIDTKLFELKFNVNSEGFEYWKYAIEIYKPNMKSMDIYRKIAIKYNKTMAQVERAMRHCVEKAKMEIAEKYKISYKVTNTTIFELLGRGILLNDY